jgi:TPR repeat protein
MFKNGEGVPQNDRAAKRWYTLAAEQGHADAQSHLGIMYAYGLGALKDKRRAYMWWNLAGYNGSEFAIDMKDKLLKKKMSPADISKAQEMSIRCLESNYTDC